MSEYKDLDGFEKNLSKFKNDWATLKPILQAGFTRLTNSLDTHSYVDLFVESRRAAPYLMGHIDAVAYPLLLIAAVVPWFFIF